LLTPEEVNNKFLLHEAKYDSIACFGAAENGN
jgi:hypothetical protein